MNKSFEIIDQQNDFVVVDKAPGISFHQEGETTGLFQAVQNELSIETLFPVHRLDKVTSGIVIFATNQAAASEFGLLFTNKRVEKYYLALSTGKPTKKQGLIKGDMEKARRGAWKLLRSTNNPAISQFRSFGTQQGPRVFFIKPYTGKTHQIRVALKSISAPILGDTLYGSKTEQTADRTYLHALGIRFGILGKTFEYSVAPTHGEHFHQSEVASLLSQQLIPPWNVSFPTLK